LRLLRLEESKSGRDASSIYVIRVEFESKATIFTLKAFSLENTINCLIELYKDGSAFSTDLSLVLEAISTRCESQFEL